MLIVKAGDFRYGSKATYLKYYLVSYISHSLCFNAREMRRGDGLAGEGGHVGRACALTSAVSTPRRILVIPKVRAPFISLDWFGSELVWPKALLFQTRQA